MTIHNPTPGNGPGLPETPLTLLEFARLVKDGAAFSDAEFIAQMRRVVPLDDLRNLPEDEALWLYQAVIWLNDYLTLLFEFHQSAGGQSMEFAGSPCLPGPSGPFIQHVLLRAHGPADFSQLESFGVREVENDL